MLYFEKKWKKSFKLGLVVQDTTFSWGSIIHLGRAVDVHKHSIALLLSAVEPAGALSAGVSWSCLVPCCV